VSTQFAYDGSEVTAEIGSGAVEASYLRNLNVDEMFGFLRQDGAYFSIYDGLGSTLALANQSTSSAVQYTYEPFGKTQTSDPAFTNPVQFTGRENDNTGLYFYRARFLSTALTRFISEEPFRHLGGDINLYTYTGNSPTRFIDPSGLAKSTRSISGPAPTRPDPNRLRPEPIDIGKLARGLGGLALSAALDKAIDKLPCSQIRANLMFVQGAVGLFNAAQFGSLAILAGLSSVRPPDPIVTPATLALAGAATVASGTELGIGLAAIVQSIDDFRHCE
jgi:RHS repeat-associated protein